ncbi:MAG TPA: FecR domain-containing protein, partial [Planctomycetota bacterium]|nr:FecR domain-containing protein [Planctomycetota bacterium]
MTGRIRRRLDATRPRRVWAAVAGVAAAAAVVAGVFLAGRPDRRPVPEPVVAGAPKAPAPAPEPAAPAPAPAVEAKPQPRPLPVPSPAAPAPAPAETEPPVRIVTRTPAPSPSVPPAASEAPPRTVAGRARIERTRGEGFIAKAGGPVAMAEGQDLLSDEELVVSPESAAVLVHPDGTRVHLTAGSRLSYPAAAAGPMLFEGGIAVNATTVEPGVFATPHAEVRARDARFTLRTDAGSTRMEVTGGSAEFVNRLDGTAGTVLSGRHAFAFAQAAVDPRRVDEAIRKGVEYLKTADSPPGPYGVKSSDELILLTYIHAGVPEGDPAFQALLKKVLDGPLETTYNVALQAMALEELHRVKYQGRIAQCAQFLVDNQCKNGQWSYGKPTPAVLDLDVPTGGARPEAASGGRGAVVEFGEKAKPKVARKIGVRRTREGIDAGDNSNSQYAALGMRACHDAGIVFPREAVMLARKYWVESAIGDPGKNDAVATGGKVMPGTPQGWCYKGYHHQLKYCKDPDTAYTSMTAGAVGALAIYDSMLGIDWKKDRTVANGLAWLVKNWSWAENVGPCEIGQSLPKTWLYYGFYAVERAGMLLDLPKIGPYDWYREGATVLLDSQRPSGAWAVSDGMAKKPTWDTCFAILFLKRATRPLVVSVDKKK